MLRRDFLKALGGLGIVNFGLDFLRKARARALDYNSFFPAQLVYGDGLKWNPRPFALRSWMEFVERRTSIPVSKERVEIKLDSKELFNYPFIYWCGEEDFPEFSPEARRRLRVYLESGGFMFVDNSLADPASGFKKGFEREFSKIFPGEVLTRLSKEHTIYQSYYLIDEPSGRKKTSNYLLGLDRGELSVLVYCENDLGGALERDFSSNYRYPVYPSGEVQRENAIRLAINIVLYALCATYKKDLIHIPFISERRRKRPR